MPPRAGRLHAERLDATQSRVIGDKRYRVLLARKLAREHVAHIQGINALQLGIFHRRVQGIVAKFTQALIPVFANLDLPNPYY